MSLVLRSVLVVGLVLSMGTAADLVAGTIYYYRDAQGVTHFTDLPDSDKFQPYDLFAPDPDVGQDQILTLVRQAARRHQMDSHLVQAVLETESNYQPRAVSRSGAKGLMQIMPETQQDLHLLRPFEPAANIEAGVRYLRELLDRFVKLPLALAAYNAGPKSVKDYAGIPPFVETRGYVQRVLARYHELKGGRRHVQSR